MSDEKLREWVKEKLDEGVEEERIRKSLENTGHDPSLVDEVKTPFEGSNVDRDPFSHDEVEEEPGKEKTDEEGPLEDASEEVVRSPEEEESGSGVSLPSPSISVPRPSWKQFGVLVLVCLIAGGGYLVNQSDFAEPEKQCVGVKMYSVSSSGGSTTADVLVVDQATVQLEIFDNGEKIGEKVKEMEGRGTITAGKVGDEVSFHGYDCQEKATIRSY